MRISGEEDMIEETLRRCGPNADPSIFRATLEAVVREEKARPDGFFGARVERGRSTERPLPTSSAPRSRRLRTERSEWLRAAVSELAPSLPTFGFHARAHVLVERLENGRLGECRRSLRSSDVLVVVSPAVKTTRLAVTVLLHELAHATLGDNEGHSPRFLVRASQFGVERDRLTAHGEELLQVLEEKLGPYPS